MEVRVLFYPPGGGNNISTSPSFGKVQLINYIPPEPNNWRILYYLPLLLY
jgi:hypothetical protein